MITLFHTDQVIVDSLQKQDWSYQVLHSGAFPIHQYRLCNVSNSTEQIQTWIAMSVQPQQQTHLCEGQNMRHDLHERHLDTWYGMHFLLILPVSMPLLLRSLPCLYIQMFQTFSVRNGNSLRIIRDHISYTCVKTCFK